ncbi:Tn3 family transposase [Streptomyces sp. AC536]|uniref:Tn3 family transposase n=1 Tax=Streptomyces buecherae TaxID=2763006 RepID=UPI00164D2B53|nr:Tn3 family transposase [Streptomyces buecherae]MBC3986781.1 Tn3 family transposase [Streptomyces buecherae]QNJ38976.1 Tn3 family transposase [Streptomyces buecherae]
MSTSPSYPLGRDYPSIPEGGLPAGLLAFFDLTESEVELILTKRGPQNRLGFAIQLTCLRSLGRLPKPQEIASLPRPVVEHVAAQLDISDGVAVLSTYGSHDGLTRRHAKEIRSACGWKPYSKGEAALKSMLVSRATYTEEGVKALLRRAVAWLREQRIELPGERTLTDLVRSVRGATDQEMWQALLAPYVDRLSELDRLTAVPDNERKSPLAELQRGPGKPAWTNLARAFARNNEVQSLGLPPADTRVFSPRRLSYLARFATEHEVQRTKRRAATVATVARLTETTADDAVDMLVHLIANDLIGRARRKTEKERSAIFPDLAHSAAVMREVGKDLLDARHEKVDTETGEIIPPVADTMTVREFLDQLEDLPAFEAAVTVAGELAPAMGSDSEEARRTKMIKRIDLLKTYLPHIVGGLAYRHGTPEARHVLDALWSLTDLIDRPAISRAEADERLLTGSWKELALRAPHLSPDMVDTAAYAFCVVERFYSRLQRREIFVEGASKWGNPEADLPSPTEWAALRASVSKSLGLPLDAVAHLKRLGQELHTKTRAIAERLPKDRQFQLSDGGRLVLSTAPLPQDPRLRKVTAELAGWLPKGDLPQLILEVLTWTKGTEVFTTPSGEPPRQCDFDITLSAALVALGCNVGVEAVAGNFPALDRRHITYVIDNFLRPDYLEALNNRLLARQSQLAVAASWNGGHMASVDGQRMVAPPSAIQARLSPHGTAHVTHLTLLSDQAMGLTNKVVAGSVHTCLHVLDVLNDRRTSALKATSTRSQNRQQEHQKIVAEASPHQEIIFGLLALSGYTYTPTAADVTDMSLARMDTAADEDYGPLQHVTRNKIDSALIERHWDDMLRLVGAVHLGRVRSADAIRMVIRNGSPTPLGKALAHYGKIFKTAHILDLIDNPDYRRQIETQSSRHGQRHELAAKIYHGTEDRIHRYQTGMEEQLGALGLIVNMVVLFNTAYIDLFLQKKASHLRPVPDEVVRSLSPFLYRHIHMKGRYAFEMPELSDISMRAVEDLDEGPYDVTDDNLVAN